MKESLVYLAVDIGAESGRLMAGRWQGSQIALQEVHRFPNGPVPLADTLRWDLLHLWREIRNGLAQASKLSDARPVSIGVDTWGVDYVLLGEHGEWMGLPYAYRDARTRGLVEEVLAQIPRAEIFAQSGTQFLEINTLYQLLAAHKNTPGLLEKTQRMLLIPDWVHWALCGSEACEFTNASTTQFLHPRLQQWSRPLLETLGIPTHFLPSIVAPGTAMGPLRSNLQRDASLPPLTVTAPATHDTASAVAAIPTERTGRCDWAYISSGTWSLVGAEVPEAHLGEAALRYNFTNEGGVDGTYRLLKNVMGLWLLQQLRSDLAQAGTVLDYGALVQLASEAPALTCVVDPDAPGFLRPTRMIETLQQTCRAAGQAAPSTPGAMARCLLESLALRYRQVLEELEQITGSRLEIIHIVGGGSRNALLNQFTADACQRPVVAGPVEATALGNVLVQARAHGEIASLHELRSIVRASCGAEIREFWPEKSRSAQWESAYERWRPLRPEIPG
jgi:rhamnulokinase